MRWSSRRLLSLLRRRFNALPYLLQLQTLLFKTDLHRRRPLLAAELVAALAPLSLPHALSFFSHLHSLPPPPLLAWNSLIRACATSPSSSSSPLDAVALFSALRRAADGPTPDHFTYPFVLAACSRALAREAGQTVHGLVVKAGFLSDLHVGNTLVHLHACCGAVECARKVFDGMQVRDVVTWSSMIQGYVSCGQPLEAMAAFRKMKQANVKPNSVTLLSLLSASSYLGSLRTGQSIHSYIIVNQIKLNLALGAAVVSMYAKCGLLEEAFQVFNSLEEKDLQSWTIMISGFVDHGRWEEAIHLFYVVEASGVRPDSTLFSIILCACSHLGMVEEGERMFNRMVTRYGIQPRIEHYGCMVDLYGRAGLIETAQEFIKTMPIIPNNVILRSFLGACRKNDKFFQIDEAWIKRLLEEEPDLGSNYVIASNASALSGQWGSVAELRCNISQRGLKKVAACSWVEVNRTEDCDILQIGV